MLEQFTKCLKCQILWPEKCASPGPMEVLDCQWHYSIRKTFVIKSRFSWLNFSKLPTWNFRWNWTTTPMFRVRLQFSLLINLYLIFEWIFIQKSVLFWGTLPCRKYYLKPLTQLKEACEFQKLKNNEIVSSRRWMFGRELIRNLKHRQNFNRIGGLRIQFQLGNFVNKTQLFFQKKIVTWWLPLEYLRRRLWRSKLRIDENWIKSKRFAIFETLPKLSAKN